MTLPARFSLLLLLVFVCPMYAGTIHRFSSEPGYGFSDWAKAYSQTEHGLLIESSSAKGGIAYTGEIDVSEHVSRIPRLRFRLITPGNSRHVDMRLIDADQTRAGFRFRFHPGNEGETYELVEVNGRHLGDADAITEPGENGLLDLDAIRTLQVLGDWKGTPFSMELLQLDTVELSPEIEALREKRKLEEARAAARQQAEEAARREHIASILEHGAEHPPVGPQVIDTALALPTLIELRIQERELHIQGQTPFQPGPEHRLQPDKQTVLAWHRGEVSEVPKFQRVLEGDTPVGIYLEAQGKLWVQETLSGEKLDDLMVDVPEAYRVTASGKPLSVTGVSRKSKPVTGPLYENEKVILHRIYLHLSGPVENGEEVRIGLHGLNTRESDVSFTADCAQTFNEALQVSQVGYRPDDPWKQASLSLWLGNGGAVDFDHLIGTPFFLIDQSNGESFPAGTVAKQMYVDEVQRSFREQRNHAGTHLYALDFSDFTRPGTYRVHVPGLGVSFPFPISEQSWEQAFRISMQGFLHHRSGIELGEPFTRYQRPLNFHPEAGTRILQSDVTRLDGESAAILQSLRRIHDRAGEFPQAWGGYMDAGDWDRRAQHLESTYLHLELLELFPERLGNLALALPESESGNSIPDLLDEALWNIDFYHRLQTPEGGIRGGVESTAHPRNGEASWQESLVVGVFAPDASSSYHFATTAAKASALLAPFDAPRAAALLESAQRAWRWAEENPAPEGIQAKFQTELRRAENLAALQLYAVTGDSSYHDHFVETSALGQDTPSLWGEEANALFLYARLPDDRGEPRLKEQAKDALIHLADAAIAFQEGNAFHLATIAPNLPMMGYVGYFSVPEMISQILPRAHYLTGDSRYLAAAIAAHNFSNGANPSNLVYTTGLGQRFPMNPLHIDSRVTGQAAPAGITIYGQSDPQAGYRFNEWVHTWQLSDAVPPSREWPTAEAYFDIFLWPAQSEYTIHQTLGPTSYYRGYLAGRE